MNDVMRAALAEMLAMLPMQSLTIRRALSTEDYGDRS